MKKTIKLTFCILTALLVTSCGSFGEGFLAGLTSFAPGGSPATSNAYWRTSPMPAAGSGNINALLDPNLAIAQVLSKEQQDYQQFCMYNRKPDGSNYTLNEYRAMVGQAYQDVKSGNTSSTTRNTKSGGGGSSSSKKKCIKISATDNAHCNGTGVCSKCNGKKKYYDTSLGIPKWVDPCVVCRGTGKCPGCQGKGYR